MHCPFTIDEVRADLHALFDDCTATEIFAVQERLRMGRVSGRYTQSCIIGIVAERRETTYDRCALRWPYGYRPVECWLLAVQFGDTPQTSAEAALLDQWITDYLAERTLQALVRVRQWQD